jgi:hypothetical protein
MLCAQAISETEVSVGDKGANTHMQSVLLSHCRALYQWQLMVTNPCVTSNCSYFLHKDARSMFSVSGG